MFMLISDYSKFPYPRQYSGENPCLARGRPGFNSPSGRNFLVNRIQHRKDGYSHGYVNSLIVILITKLYFTLIQFYKTTMQDSISITFTMKKFFPIFATPLHGKDFIIKFMYCKKYENILAERSFDLRTSGLWAQHASTAPLCFSYHLEKSKIFQNLQTNQATWKIKTNISNSS